MKRTTSMKNFILCSFLAAALAISVASSAMPVWAAEETTETLAEVFIEESTPQASDSAAPKDVATELVDAPPIVPEGSAADNNIFGVADMYYVTIPKHMAFRKLPNGDYETVETSRYTVNSALDENHRLSVSVAGVNSDDTVQLSDEGERVYRKVEVSTQAYDVWKYRPDGTRLEVNGADALGYGKELTLIGPGKFFAKCRLSKFGDDEIHAGTWTGTILFTVSCTPDPTVESTEVTDEDDSDTNNIEETEDETDEDEVIEEDAAGGSADGDPKETPAAGASESLNISTPAPAAPVQSIPKQEAEVPLPEEEEEEILEDEPIVLDDGALMDVSQIEPEGDSLEGTSEESEDEGSEPE